MEFEKSCTGRRWVAREYDERITLALAQRHNLPEIIARSLNARGVGIDDAPQFLDPKLRDLLPDPDSLKDMSRSAARFADAVRKNESIVVFGDYDVDGATSSALLFLFAKSLGVALRIYIPHRLKEGYGPNPDAMRQFAKDGVKLVVCVDCGTTAFEALAAAHDAGLDVIVLDHHTSEPSLPAAFAVVNPNRLDETSNCAMLAAVGVAYLFVISANRVLRSAGYYDGEHSEPDLMQWLDLVALGTVCDVVPLTGLNRAFVAQGLRIMSQRGNAGISALAQIAGTRFLDTYAAGFILGPRINAGGRFGESDIGAKLLSMDDFNEAFPLAQRLNILNEQRRVIETRVLLEAEKLTMKENLPMAFVASDNWHPGVHRHRRLAAEGQIPPPRARHCPFRKYWQRFGPLDRQRRPRREHHRGASGGDFLIHGGGHKMAAGFTVARDKIDALRDFLAARIGKQMEAEPLTPILTLDGLVAGPALQPDFVRLIEKLGPFGTGNPEPRFALADCKIIRADVVGEKHVSVIFVQSGTRIRGIAFRAMDSELGQALLKGGERLHLAGHLRIDEWQGDERIQLHISDAAVQAP